MAEPLGRSLSPGARTAVTMGVLSLLLVVGAVWGWSAVTEPLPGKADAPLCTMVDVEEGERVYPEQVTVSVLNAGDRVGLAGRVMGQLTDDGFGEGDSSNAPDDADVRRAQIWSDDPTHPAVRLVRSRLGGKVPVLDRDTAAAGVVVVVGDRFRDVVEGREFVVARSDTRVCSPRVG